jgi:hypothetical protein
MVPYPFCDVHVCVYVRTIFFVLFPSWLDEIKKQINNLIPILTMF